MEKWLSVADCPNSFYQMEKDMEQWDFIDFRKAIQKVENSWGKSENKYSYSLCHYQIVENKVFVSCLD